MHLKCPKVDYIFVSVLKKEYLLTFCGVEKTQVSS